MTKLLDLSSIRVLLDAIEGAGGTPTVVGGSVRDALLGFDSKDFDVEVFGLTAQQLTDCLSGFKCDFVGSAFGIIKVTLEGLDEPVDVSLPRTENKTGQGHTGFLVDVNPFMSFCEAASRRDFTINALAVDSKGVLLKESCMFNGLKDLEDKVLRATDPNTFVEDPLRVLRAAQFLARFEFTAAPSLIELCKTLDLSELPAERFFEEFKKLFTRGVKPSLGLQFLKDCNQLSHFHGLNELVGCLQEVEWHPEGDAWEHTCLVTDAAVQICNREGITGERKFMLVLASFLHDIGKPTTTFYLDGRWRSPGHAQAGVPFAIEFMTQIKVPLAIQAMVCPLVAEHMCHVCCYKGDQVSKPMVRRLATRLHPATIDDLRIVCEADHSGRYPLPPGSPLVKLGFIDVAKELSLEVAKPSPILMGRHLIGLGMKPGVQFKLILDAAMNAQMDGLFDDIDGALLWLKDNK